jgi:hypothetical protein
MRAFTLESFDAPPRLRDDLPEPPAANELLVRVRTSSVNGAPAAQSREFGMPAQRST